MAFTLNNGGFSADRGEAFTITATEVSLTDAVADDYFTVSTLPTYGTLFKAEVPLAVGDTFTEADITAGNILYANDGGQATNDAIGLTAYDSTLDSTAAEVSGTVTVADNNGWALVLKPDGYPPLIGGVYAAQHRANAQAAAWTNYNSGVTHVNKVSTAGNLSLTGVIARGETWSVFETDFFQLVDKEQTMLERGTAKMLEVLDGEFSEFKTLVQNNGAGILTGDTLTNDLRAKLHEFQNATQFTHKVKSTRWLDLWKVTLDRAARELNA